jgi:hypothetical protein
MTTRLLALLLLLGTIDARDRRWRAHAIAPRVVALTPAPIATAGRELGGRFLFLFLLPPRADGFEPLLRFRRRLFRLCLGSCRKRGFDRGVNAGKVGRYPFEQPVVGLADGRMCLGCTVLGVKIFVDGEKKK